MDLQQQQQQIAHFNSTFQEIMSPPTIASHQQHDLASSCISPVSQQTDISSHLIHNGHSATAPATPITVPSNGHTLFPYPSQQPPLIVSTQQSHNTPIIVSSQQSHTTPPIISTQQPELINDNHPIVLSQRPQHHQLQRQIEEEHERVAAATQQAMAQQYALMHGLSHETPHVVLSQINSPLFHMKRAHTDTNHLASSIKKKSRRHTVSTPSLNINTSNLPTQVNAPLSAATTSHDIRKIQHKQALGTIALPPPPTPQELGLTNSNPIIDKKLKAYKCMTKEQLITRLLELETEKLSVKTDEIVVPSQHIITPQKTPFLHQPIDGGDIDEDEEEDEEEEGDEEPAAIIEKELACRWKNCSEIASDLSSLTSHISEKHVGSGKNMYSCEWEGCSRESKPFSKRHKMYNHIRTHTGERPFVCDCGKRFSRLDSLTTHIKTHSNIRPYVCSVAGCEKAYYHSRSLRKHEKTHMPLPTGLEQQEKIL